MAEPSFTGFKLIKGFYEMLIGLIVGLGVIAAVIGLAWWLLIETEGVYLGQGVVTWLYDRYADRYDGIKEYQPDYEYALLARPIMGEIAPLTAPLVLDVATGTGRLPVALCGHEQFEGYIIGVDLSARMLAKAAEKLPDAPVAWLRCPAERLPFDDATFDVVTCLEALEFTPNPAETLRECVRVLRPGGVLLVTNRINTRMPGRLWSEAEILALLESYGVGIAQTELWQEDYQKVWGLKDFEIETPPHELAKQAQPTAF